VKKFDLSLQWKFFLCIVLIVVPTLSFIFTWTGFQNEKQAVEQVVNRARVLARQIILTRQWVTDCGGVMVAGDSKGAKDVVSFFDDKLVTSRGWYQRFTPSMVTKKLSQYSLSQDLYRFRLASLNPLNPDNRADDFEKEALKKFRANGLTELYRFDNLGEKRHFHYVAPLYLEKGCIKCHNAKGEAPNIIRGGLSVILPIDDMASAVKKNHLKLAVSGAVLIFLSLFTLFGLTRRFVVKPLKDMERMTSEIGKGNLDARVNIRTGDEFQKLGEAFNTMAQKLAEARESLESKVAHATCELSEANRELKTLDKLKSDFLANMSHELRSPLTVLRGGVDYLSRTLKIEDNRNYLQIIDKNLNRLIHLVSDLFDFTKIEAQKTEWTFEHENLAVLIEEVIEIIGPLSLDKKIIINYEKAVDILVEMDVERIEQVLVNLIENAIKFSDPETEIQVRIKEDPQSVTVSVKDCGIGIPQENLESIFDKFSTVPSGRDGNPEGTGLGLAICKAIIEAHNGRIWAESVKGVSSTFYFELPKQSRRHKH